MLNQFIPIEWISALGWTVLHSIWQITLITIIVKLLMLGLQKKSPQLRYAIGVTALLTICITSIVTFYSVFENNYQENNFGISEAFPTAIQSILSVDATEIGASFFDKIISFLEGHLSLIVGIWSIGFVLFFLKMFSGFYFIEKIKKRGHHPVETTFQERLQVLSNRMHIKQSVKLVESSLVKVPMMLGYFKPIILLPINLISGVDEKMIEAIIAHELAHIKRNDFMVNIFQTLLESLFYFHPAVWWISNQVREEREKCCDDLAIKACNDSLVYAKSLLHVQTIALNQNGLSLAFTGKNKKHLLNRVKRILNQTQQNSNFMEKVIVLSLLIVSFIGMSFSFNSDKKLESTEPSSFIASLEMPFANIESDEIITTKKNKNKDKQVITTVIDDQVVYAKIENNEVKKLKIDGSKIAKSDYPKYSTIIQKLQSIGQPIQANVMAFPSPPNSPSELIASNDEMVLFPPSPPSSPMMLENPIPTPKPAPIPIFASPTGPVPPVPPVDLTSSSTRVDSTEMMIIGDDADVSVIEIKDGNVYINGEIVEGDQKIIINNQTSINELAVLKEALKGLEEIEMENIVINEHFSSEEIEQITEEALRNAFESLEEIEMENIIIQQDAMNEAERVAEELRIEHERMTEEMHHNNTDIMIEAIEAALLEDGLIESTDEYSFALKKDKLKINGKKQPKNILKKYLSIYESIMGTKLTGDHGFMVTKNH